MWPPQPSRNPANSGSPHLKWKCCAVMLSNNRKGRGSPKSSKMRKEIRLDNKGKHSTFFTSWVNLKSVLNTFCTFALQWPVINEQAVHCYIRRKKPEQNLPASRTSCLSRGSRSAWASLCIRSAVSIWPTNFFPVIRSTFIIFEPTAYQSLSS